MDERRRIGSRTLVPVRSYGGPLLTRTLSKPRCRCESIEFTGFSILQATKAASVWPNSIRFGVERGDLQSTGTIALVYQSNLGSLIEAT